MTVGDVVKAMDCQTTRVRAYLDLRTLATRLRADGNTATAAAVERAMHELADLPVDAPGTRYTLVADEGVATVEPAAAAVEPSDDDETADAGDGRACVKFPRALVDRVKAEGRANRARSVHQMIGWAMDAWAMLSHDQREAVIAASVGGAA